MHLYGYHGWNCPFISAFTPNFTRRMVNSEKANPPKNKREWEEKVIYVNNMLELENQMMTDLADQRKLKHGPVCA